MPSKYEQVWTFQDLAEAISDNEEAHAVKISVQVGMFTRGASLTLVLRVYDIEGNVDMGEQSRSLIRNGKDSSRVISAMCHAVHALEANWRANAWLAPSKLRRALRDAPREEQRLPSAPLPKF